MVLGSSEANLLNLNSNYFNHIRIWNELPYGLYIEWLDPIEPWEVSLNALFSQLDERKIKFTCSCPQERIRRFLSNRYIMYYDVAGSRFYANFVPKLNISLLAIPEDQSKLLIKEKLSPSDKIPGSPKVLFRTGTQK